MKNPNRLAIESVLDEFLHPRSFEPLFQSGAIIALNLKDNHVNLVVEFADYKIAEEFRLEREKIEAALKSLEFVHSVDLAISAPKAPQSVDENRLAQDTHSPKPNWQKSPANFSPSRRPEGVKRIIAIGSGKGGVGKSTITSNLAIALAQARKRVAVLDLDIFGPSQGTMFQLDDQPEMNAQKEIIPNERFGIRVLSMAQLVSHGDAIVWRGPMVMKALDQLLFGVEWGEVDFLLIDLPPGTGDVPLSLSQKTLIDGAIIVSTPQDVALLDARRAISMFEKLNVPILGLLENMAVHICTNCGYEEHIFGSGGAKHEAELRNLPFLGALPLDLEIRLAGDAGKPYAIENKEYFQIAVDKISALL